MPTDQPRQSESVVFIVDDDEAVRSSLQMLVRSLGFRSQAFGSGQEFLDAFDGNSDGCVLLDVRMPGMNGFEVEQRLNAMDADIPVIFLTAQGEDEIPPRAGTVDRIQKPFRDEELIGRLHDLLGA